MIELTEILKRATAAIEQEYFRIEIDGGDPVYRERVYCYELYHQMRCLWPKDSPFYLNGELDKAAHPILKRLGADYAKPDLLVHRPGFMSRNHAIIEVKRADTDNEGIMKDLKTLDKFLRDVGYQRAIYLFFGERINDSLLERVQLYKEKLNIYSQIELWKHQYAGHPAIKQIYLFKKKRDKI